MRSKDNHKADKEGVNIAVERARERDKATEREREREKDHTI